MAILDFNIPDKDEDFKVFADTAYGLFRIIDYEFILHARLHTHRNDILEAFKFRARATENETHYVYFHTRSGTQIVELDINGDYITPPPEYLDNAFHFLICKNINDLRAPIPD